MSSMPTTASIVIDLEDLKHEVIANKKLSILKRVQATVNITSAQIRTARLELDYKKASAKFAESPPTTVPLASVPQIEESK